MQMIKIIQTGITKLQHYANEKLLTLIHMGFNIALMFLFNHYIKNKIIAEFPSMFI